MDPKSESEERGRAPEPKPLPPTVRGAMWIAVVVLALIGVAGVLLPLVPGTPFLVLSLVLLARTSPRIYRKIYQHPRWGRWFRPR